jgi:hypothetical protein
MCFKLKTGSWRQLFVSVLNTYILKVYVINVNTGQSASCASDTVPVGDTILFPRGCDSLEFSVYRSQTHSVRSTSQ